MEYDDKFLWHETRDYKIFKAANKQDRFCEVLIKEYKQHVDEDKMHFEKEILTSLKGNKKFIQLLDSYSSATAYRLVLENCHFTLQQYSDNTLFKDRVIADITWELFESVRQLNNNNVYLLNLRPENVWVQIDPRTNSCTFKITDFLDVVRDPEPPLKPPCEPNEYVAPEAFQKHCGYHLTKADIYSLGKIMLSLKLKEPSDACKFEKKSPEQRKADLDSMNEYLKMILERSVEEIPTRRANLFHIYILYKDYYKSDLR
jgi:serine/threonine protein kinase